jgi:proline dehydrogenase
MRSVNELENLRKNIDKLTKFHHIEILKILTLHEVTINENNYGIFVNMSELDDIIVDKIEHYLEYTEEQEQQLKNIEYEKVMLKSKYFESENKYLTEEC